MKNEYLKKFEKANVNQKEFAKLTLASGVCFLLDKQENEKAHEILIESIKVNISEDDWKKNRGAYLRPINAIRALYNARHDILTSIFNANKKIDENINNILDYLKDNNLSIEKINKTYNVSGVLKSTKEKNQKNKKQDQDQDQNQDQNQDQKLLSNGEKIQLALKIIDFALQNTTFSDFTKKELEKRGFKHIPAGTVVVTKKVA